LAHLLGPLSRSEAFLLEQFQVRKSEISNCSAKTRNPGPLVEPKDSLRDLHLRGSIRLVQSPQIPRRQKILRGRVASSHFSPLTISSAPDDLELIFPKSGPQLKE